MKEQIMNWFKRLLTNMYAVCLIFVSIGMVAFGLAGMGEDLMTDDIVTEVSLNSAEDAEEFAAE